MPNKMEQFTRRARMSLSYAQDAAVRLEHGLITPEHLLIALSQIDGGVSQAVLQNAFKLTPTELEATVKKLSTTKKHSSDAELDLSADIKKVLEMAVDEARRVGHHYIGTEHLLLGLLRFDNNGLDILREFSVMPEQVREQVQHTINSDTDNSTR